MIVGIASFNLLHFFHARAQASTKSAAGGGPESTDLKTLAVSFILPASDETKLRRLAEQGQVSLSSSKAYIPLPEDAETFPDPGFAPLVIIVGALVLGYVAKIAFGLWGEYSYGGLIVDTRKMPIEIREHRALARGHIVIIKPDGTPVNFQPKDETDLERILKEVLK